MAILDPTNRARVAAQWMRDNKAVLGSLSKAELRAAADACDQWIDDNQASFNSALPQPARAELTLTQKTHLFCYVALRRAGRLRAEEDE